MTHGLTDDNGRKPPVTIEIKRGITIQGNYNNIHITDYGMPATSSHSGLADNHTSRTDLESMSSDASELNDYKEFEEEDAQEPPVKRRCVSEDWFWEVADHEGGSY